MAVEQAEEFRMEIVLVTPTMAQEFLAKNRANRRFRPSVYARYSEDMRAGRWRLRGQSPILFDRDGYMVNGQHRCMASIQSGAAFPVYVIRDCDPEDVDNIDNGANRTLGDVLGWRGESEPGKLASALRWCWLYESGKLATQYTQTPTKSEAIEWLKAHPDLPAAIDAVNDLRKAPVKLPIAPGATLFYFSFKEFPAEAEAFFSALRTGANLPEGSPVLALRGYLAKPSRNRGGSTFHREVTAVGIKAFNAHVREQVIGQLRFKSRGKKPERFPILITQAQARKEAADDDRS